MHPVVFHSSNPTEFHLYAVGPVRPLPPLDGPRRLAPRQQHLLRRGAAGRPPHRAPPGRRPRRLRTAQRPPRIAEDVEPPEPQEQCCLHFNTNHDMSLNKTGTSIMFFL